MYAVGDDVDRRPPDRPGDLLVDFFPQAVLCGRGLVLGYHQDVEVAPVLVDDPVLAVREVSSFIAVGLVLMGIV
jgi:hypothetical protein